MDEGMDHPADDPGEATEAAPEGPSGQGRPLGPILAFLPLLVLTAGAIAYDGVGLRLPTLPALPSAPWESALGFVPALILVVAAAVMAGRSGNTSPSQGLGWTTSGALLLLGLAGSKALLLARPLEGVSWASPEVLLPVLLVILPVAVTCSRSFAFFFLLLLAGLVGFAGAGTWGWDLTVLSLGAGLPGILLGSRAHGRGALVVAGAAGGAGLSLASVGVEIVRAGWNPLSGSGLPEGLGSALAGVPNGLLSGVAVSLALPLIEALLGKTSNISLAGLLRLDHPLLTWIQKNAPGTYHHSLNVGAIAAAGARSIGANPLLAQAGGHFHDIGKVRRAGYFMENIRGRNPHDDKSPKESAEIILAHAREGYEIARKKGLPPEVAAITREHQGTTLIEWFYSKAKKMEGGAVDGDYRYPGPKPQGREAALVMLADSVEAICRTLESPDRAALEKSVDFILQKKQAEEQLEECGIREGQVPRIRKAFVESLEDIHHRRIKYPSDLGAPSAPPGTPEQGSPATPPGETSP